MVTVEAAAVEGGRGHSSCFYQIDIRQYCHHCTATAGQVLVASSWLGYWLISKCKCVSPVFRARRRSLLLFSRDFEQTIINQSISPKTEAPPSCCRPALGEDHWEPNGRSFARERWLGVTCDRAVEQRHWWQGAWDELKSSQVTGDIRYYNLLCIVNSYHNWA